VDRLGRNTSIVDHIGWKKLYFKGINQIENLLKNLKENPDSRRHIISAWNVEDIDDMLLPPCHILFQFYTIKMSEKERIDLFKIWLNEHNMDVNKDAINDAIEYYNFPERKLSLQLYQRSTDSYLGLPYNIASYSMLLHIIAQQVNMIPYEFVWTGGDVHLYTNSIDASETIISRTPFNLPKLLIKKKENITDYRYEDFEIVDYQSHENIKVDVAV